MRRIKITEEQLNELKNSLTINPTNTANMTNIERAQLGKNIATSNPNTSVYVDGQEVNSDSNPAEVAQTSVQTAQSVLSNTNECEVFTKKQIKEEKVRRLKNNCVVYSKKTIDNLK